MDCKSPVTTALISNTIGASSGLVKEVKCEICNLMVSSYVVLTQHIAGRKHKNQFKLLVNSKEIDLNCVICGHLSKNYDEWELHITSEQHVEKAKLFKPISAQVITHPQPIQMDPRMNKIPPLLPPQELLKLTAKFEEQMNQKLLNQIVAKGIKEWKCTHCNVTCQSICSWEAHLISKKHRKSKHKFHTYPGISKEIVKQKYQNSFVRAAKTSGNEFIEDDIIFFCKRCDCRMQTKLQLEIHMSSHQHKMNHPIATAPVAEPCSVQNSQQLFNFESSYGYGFRNWSGEQNFYNPTPQLSRDELQLQHERERQQKLVEQAKNDLLARFPFYAINLQNNLLAKQEKSLQLPDNIPIPETPRPVEAPEKYNF